MFPKSLALPTGRPKSALEILASLRPYKGSYFKHFWRDYKNVLKSLALPIRRPKNRQHSGNVGLTTLGLSGRACGTLVSLR